MEKAMTVQNTAYRADYTGNGVTKTFTVPFYFLDNTHLEVLLTDNSVTPAVTTTLALNSDYSVSGAGVSSGGSITTLATNAYSSSYDITILRDVPYAQDTHYVEGDPFPAASHEKALDLLTMQNQQQQEQLDRAFKLAPSATAGTVDLVPVARYALAWDDDLNLVSVPNSSADQSAALASLLPSEGAGLVGFDPDASYASGTVGKNLTDLVSTGKTANTPAHTITKTTTDSTTPNITMLLKNTQDSGSGTDYDNEVHLRLQAGTTTDHRTYINFADHTGTDKWVTGRNASSVWILYNSETIHRFWFEPTTGVFNTGNSYINSAGTGKIRFNWHPSDTTGTGGIEVWSGGTPGVNTLWFDVQATTGATKVYNTTQASNGAGAFACAGGGYFAKNFIAGGHLEARASGSFVTTNLYIDDAAATTRQFYFTSAGVQRWIFQTNASAESGSDAGSNFDILARTDAGGAIDSVFQAVRASGGTTTLGGSTNRVVQIAGTGGLQVDGKAKMQTKQLTGKVKAANGSTTTYTVPANTGYVYITTTAASLQITFPTGSNALDGLEITVVLSAAVGTLTWVSAGATFVGAPAAGAANTPYRFIWHNATSEWLPR